MKYRIVEIPWVNYEVQDENGETYGNEQGNVFETKEEAESVIKDLKNPLDQGRHYREYFLGRGDSNGI
jgi:hypothetical protein